MIGLADVRDWLKSLNAFDATWTIGRYEAEKEKRVCVYQRPDYTDATVALGGREATKTLVKQISVLVHWNKNHKETEAAAQALYSKLQFNPRATIGNATASYIDLRLPEPADAGSDANGIFERVIWLDIYFQED